MDFQNEPKPRQIRVGMLCLTRLAKSGKMPTEMVYIMTLRQPIPRKWMLRRPMQRKLMSRRPTPKKMVQREPKLQRLTPRAPMTRVVRKLGWTPRKTPRLRKLMLMTLSLGCLHACGSASTFLPPTQWATVGCRHYHEMTFINLFTLSCAINMTFRSNCLNSKELTPTVASPHRVIKTIPIKNKRQVWRSESLTLD